MFSNAVHLYKFGGGRIQLEVADTDNFKLIVPDTKPEKNEE
jgi:hypothetical protein